MTGLVLKRTNLDPITLYFCSPTGCPITCPQTTGKSLHIIHNMYLEHTTIDNNVMVLSLCKILIVNISLIGWVVGYHHECKCRVIDARFVRFRIKYFISENLNTQLPKNKKLHYFKI